MIGSVVLTALAVVGIAKWTRHRMRHAYGFSTCGGWHPGHSFRGGPLRGGFGGGWGSDGDMSFEPPPWRRPDPDGDAWLWGALEHINATPAQERTLRAAVAEFRQSLRQHRGEWRHTHLSLAEAMRRPVFDETTLGELYGRHDGVIEEMRKSFVGLWAKVHEALEDKQRQRLADLVARGPGRLFCQHLGGRWQWG